MPHLLQSLLLPFTPSFAAHHSQKLQETTPNLDYYIRKLNEEDEKIAVAEEAAHVRTSKKEYGEGSVSSSLVQMIRGGRRPPATRGVGVHDSSGKPPAEYEDAGGRHASAAGGMHSELAAHATSKICVGQSRLVLLQVQREAGGRESDALFLAVLKVVMMY